MSFVQDCIADSLPVWEQCLNSPFLQKLEDGTLDEGCFVGYIVEDSLYLREYAKVFAWGIVKAQTMEDIRTLYSLLAFVNEGEDATRLRYLARYGLRDADVQRLPQRPQNKTYTDCMLAAAQQGEGLAECMMACLPCMISYSWIFRRLAARTPAVLDGPYGPLVRDYAGEEYAAACESWAAYTDGLCAGLTAERAARCKAIFRACSEHELHFWQMSEQPRADLPALRIDG